MIFVEPPITDEAAYNSERTWAGMHYMFRAMRDELSAEQLRADLAYNETIITSNPKLASRYLAWLHEAREVQAQQLTTDAQLLAAEAFTELARARARAAFATQPTAPVAADQTRADQPSDMQPPQELS